jgi:dephospho-CoA kinase
MKIAIIGPAGAGKSTLTRYFKSNNSHIIECDAVIHDAFINNRVVIEWIRKTFSDAVFENGIISRKLLGTVVFANAELRTLLEDFLYETVLLPTTSTSTASTIIVDGILPRFIDASFDQVIYVYLTEEERISRLLKRGVSRERIDEILKVQRDIFKPPQHCS